VPLHRDVCEAHLKMPLARWALYFFVPWLIAEARSDDNVSSKDLVA
jgi:hypothetical protein